MSDIQVATIDAIFGSGSVTTSNTSNTAEMEDVSHFDSLMEIDELQDPLECDAVGCIEKSDSTDLTSSLWDTVQEWRQGYVDGFNAVKETLTPAISTPQGLMNVHWELVKLDLYQEVTTQVASKVTQHCDTLLKSQ